nr:hypothetical protein [uncultured Dysosmobacter sp.]
MKKRNWSAAFEKAGIAAAVLAAMLFRVLVEWGGEPAAGIALLPSAVLLGIAAVLNWRLPQEQRARVEVSAFRGPRHVYLWFLLVVGFIVFVFLRAVSIEISKVWLICWAVGYVAAFIYAEWYGRVGRKKKQCRKGKK